MNRRTEGVDTSGVKPPVLRLLRRTAVGGVLICAAVPMLQNQLVSIAKAEDSGPVVSVTGDVRGLEPG